MSKTKKVRFGQLPPRYKFVLNPYPDMRISRCPYCEHKTGQKKLPLLIHIDPQQLIALNYTSRYCRTCDLLIAHKYEIEHLLTSLFSQTDPKIVGNQYLIVGTVEKQLWREGSQSAKTLDEMLPHTSDFIKNYQELRFTQPGWYPEGKEPLEMKPPVSQEWVKIK